MLVWKLVRVSSRSIFAARFQLLRYAVDKNFVYTAMHLVLHLAEVFQISGVLILIRIRYLKP